MFIGGPLRLGSSIDSVDAQAGVGRTLMGASGPHYCEDPLVDQGSGNMIYQNLHAWIRIRRSCSALRSASDERAQMHGIDYPAGPARL